MEKDMASTPNKGKDIDVGNASDNEMAEDILGKLYTDVGQMPLQRSDSDSSKSKPCIYSVPKPLRYVNWKAYTPLRISIGPLHRDNKRLEAMEKEKQKYFKKLIERNGIDKNKMRDIVINIKNQEERLRHCYSEKFILMESRDFVTMILLDAVFIIQFFSKSNFDPTMSFGIREDLILLENQLPLFIIQEIYDRVIPSSQDAEAISFLDLATCHFRKYSFFKRVETSMDVEKETSPGVEGSRHFTDLLRNLMSCKTILGVKKETSSGVEKETSSGVEGSRHFTDLLRKLMLNGASEQSKESRAIDEQSKDNLNPPRQLKHSVVMLRKAGVRFKSTQDKCLVNITFDKGVLKIPRLEIDHYFERLVRNIMALEQCCYSSEAYICGYMKLMDHLIDSAEDVGLLVEKGIIVHRLGNDAAVSNMINNLCENIDHHTCFGHISQGLNDHCKSPFNRAIGTLALGYFPNIWRGTATVAAAILLILTFIQTISSVQSFY